MDPTQYDIFNYFLEPMLLTSLLLLPISFIYFKKKYYILAILIFFNGIFSYLYHLDQNKHKCGENTSITSSTLATSTTPLDTSTNPLDTSTNPLATLNTTRLEEDVDRENHHLLLDMTVSILSFLFSLKAAVDLAKKTQLILAFIVIIAFTFYYFNCKLKSYFCHLFWHISVLLGQLVLSLGL